MAAHTIHISLARMTIEPNINIAQSLSAQAFAIMHEVAVQLSSAVQQRLESSGAVWEPPSSFNRKTTKYWVPNQFIFPLKVRACGCTTYP